MYDRWREIVLECGDELALRDAAAGRQWTFRQLAAEAERFNPPGDPVCFPQGAGPGFILQTLAAWRAGVAVCPLEAGQSKPRLGGSAPRGVVHLKTTSGSTRAARFVAFTAGQIVADAENIVQTMGLRRDWPNLATLSLAHSYGFSNLVLPLLLHGIPLILVGSALPEAVRAAAALVPELALPAVPALWRTWHDAQSIPANVRLAISAGAPLPLGLEETVYVKSQVKIHNFYGSTECGGIAFDSSAEPRKNAAFAGTCMAGVKVAVAVDGCLEVTSMAVGESYWPEPDTNLGHGIFKTSDLGCISGNQVFLRGRVTDLINVAGRKVSPEVVEQVLAGHPRVRACLVFGVPAAQLGREEKVVACVSTEDPAGLEDLKRFAGEHLPSWQVPREWWVLDELEYNARGKLSRPEWRARYLARWSQPLAS